MQINLLKNLVSELSKEEDAKIIDVLFDKKDVNEFLIAKKMGTTINYIRNILYKLSAEGLVSFIRKRDKRKGWYIYFWTLDIEKCLQKIEEKLIEKERNLNSLLVQREHNRYYLCKGCNVEVTEETALKNDFSCEECASVYILVDNTNSIRDLKGKITKKENEIKEIRKELEVVRAEKQVAQKKKNAKEDRKKAKLKKEKREKNKKKKVKKKLRSKKKKVLKRNKKRRR